MPLCSVGMKDLTRLRSSTYEPGIGSGDIENTTGISMEQSVRKCHDHRCHIFDYRRGIYPSVGLFVAPQLVSMVFKTCR